MQVIDIRIFHEKYMTAIEAVWLSQAVLQWQTSKNDVSLLALLLHFFSPNRLSLWFLFPFK